MKRHSFALVRSFSIGFEIYSPKQNGWICFAVKVGCFQYSYGRKWNKGIKFNNYWNG